MRNSEFTRRIRLLERQFFTVGIDIDFLGLWDPDDSDWETVDVERGLPEYAEQLVIQRHKETGRLRGLFDDKVPAGADLRYL